jgi:hypothetical protein
VPYSVNDLTHLNARVEEMFKIINALNLFMFETLVCRPPEKKK